MCNLSLDRLWARLAVAGRTAIDLIYPPRCAGCGRFGVLFCSTCRDGVMPIPADVCRLCGRPGAGPGLCLSCRRRQTALDGVLSCAVYAEPLRSAIHSFKYRGTRSLAGPLGDMMVSTWQARGLSADCLVAVPLHAVRQAERGYNQSVLLAQVLSMRLKIPATPELLCRERATRPQVTLSMAERQTNVAGAFRHGGTVAGRRVVLVDDVCTTGATMEACAAALRMGGAAAVQGFTLARAAWDATDAPGRPVLESR